MLWLLLLLLLALGLGLPHQAQAQQVTCANPTVSNVQFGNVDLSSGAASVTGSIAWSCTSAAALVILLSPQANVAMCLDLNAGTGGASYDPRLLANGTGHLQYQLYADPGHVTKWNATATSIPLMIQVNIPAGLLFSKTVNGSTPFYALLPGGQATATTGAYSSTLGVSTNGTYTLSRNTTLATCTSGQTHLNNGSASFTVSATMQKACQVSAGSASNINLGSVPFNATNTAANGHIGITCSNGTPYFVGLKPSNGSTNGAGTMHGTLAGNTDLVPYQLRSGTGTAGAPWGNTATSTSVGNGQSGIGDGANQSMTVYATVASANFRPDSYADTVTVSVNY
jgi:spore coat protein U-like protein